MNDTTTVAAADDTNKPADEKKADETAKPAAEETKAA